MDDKANQPTQKAARLISGVVYHKIKQKVYDRNDIVEAHTQIQSGHSRGKIVVSMLCNGA